MMAALFLLVAAGLGLLAGAPWWILAPVAVGLIPGRLAPTGAALAVLVLLPWSTSVAGALACFAAGILAAWAPLYRLGRAVPWAALPWLGGAVLVLSLTWSFLPPVGYWADADVSLRARILLLAAVAVVAGAVTYLPRYRNPPPGLAATGADGTSGGREETR